MATRRGTRVRVQRRDRFNSGTRERGSDSDRRRRAPFPSAPGEEHQSSSARDRSRKAETLRGSVHESPVRPWPHAPKPELR